MFKFLLLYTEKLRSSSASLRFIHLLGVHFGSALSSKSGITLPVLKLLILLATKTSSACFLLRENASQLKSSSVTIGTANNSEQSAIGRTLLRRLDIRTLLCR